MLSDCGNWGALCHTSSAEVTWDGRTGTNITVDRLSLVMDSDPSLRTMPLWEADIRFDREQTDSISEWAAIGKVIQIRIMSDINAQVLGGMTVPKEEKMWISMIISSVSRDDSGCLRITARDARAMFDTVLNDFTASGVSEDAVYVAITERFGNRVTYEGVSGEYAGARMTVISSDNPFSMSALVLDVARTVVILTDEEVAQGVYLGGGPCSLVPKVSTSPMQKMGLVMTGVLGRAGRALVGVPDDAVLTWPAVRGSNQFNAVQTSVRFEDEVLKAEVGSGSALDIVANISTRCFGETSMPGEGFRTMADRLATMAAVVMGMPEYRCRVVGNPCIEVGDALYIRMEDGTRKEFVVKKHVLTYEGDLVSDLSLLEYFRYVNIVAADLPESSGASGTVATVSIGPSDYVTFFWPSVPTATPSWSGNAPAGVTLFGKRGLCGFFPEGTWNLNVDSITYRFVCTSEEEDDASGISLTAEDFS